MKFLKKLYVESCNYLWIPFLVFAIVLLTHPLWRLTQYSKEGVIVFSFPILGMFIIGLFVLRLSLHLRKQSKTKPHQ